MGSISMTMSSMANFVMVPSLLDNHIAALIRQRTSDDELCNVSNVLPSAIDLIIGFIDRWDKGSDQSIQKRTDQPDDMLQLAAKVACETSFQLEDVERIPVRSQGPLLDAITAYCYRGSNSNSNVYHQLTLLRDRWRLRNDTSAENGIIQSDVANSVHRLEQWCTQPSSTSSFFLQVAADLCKFYFRRNNIEYAERWALTALSTVDGMDAKLCPPTSHLHSELKGIITACKSAQDLSPLSMSLPARRHRLYAAVADMFDVDQRHPQRPMPYLSNVIGGVRDEELAMEYITLSVSGVGTLRDIVPSIHFAECLFREAALLHKENLRLSHSSLLERDAATAIVSVLCDRVGNACVKIADHMSLCRTLSHVRANDVGKFCWSVWDLWETCCPLLFHWVGGSSKRRLARSLCRCDMTPASASVRYAYTQERLENGMPPIEEQLTSVFAPLALGSAGAGILIQNFDSFSLSETAVGSEIPLELRLLTVLRRCRATCVEPPEEWAVALQVSQPLCYQWVAQQVSLLSDGPNVRTIYSEAMLGASLFQSPVAFSTVKDLIIKMAQGIIPPAPGWMVRIALVKLLDQHLYSDIVEICSAMNAYPSPNQPSPASNYGDDRSPWMWGDSDFFGGREAVSEHRRRGKENVGSMIAISMTFASICEAAESWERSRRGPPGLGSDVSRVMILFDRLLKEVLTMHGSMWVGLSQQEVWTPILAAWLGKWLYFYPLSQSDEVRCFDGFAAWSQSTVPWQVLIVCCCAVIKGFRNDDDDCCRGPWIASLPLSDMIGEGMRWWQKQHDVPQPLLHTSSVKSGERTPDAMEVAALGVLRVAVSVINRLEPMQVQWICLEGQVAYMTGRWGASVRLFCAAMAVETQVFQASEGEGVAFPFSEVAILAKCIHSLLSCEAVIQAMTVCQLLPAPLGSGTSSALMSVVQSTLPSLANRVVYLRHLWDPSIIEVWMNYYHCCSHTEGEEEVMAIVSQPGFVNYATQSMPYLIRVLNLFKCLFQEFQ